MLFSTLSYHAYALVVHAQLNFMYQLLQEHSDKFIVESAVELVVFLKESKLKPKALKLLSIKFVFLELCYCSNNNISPLTFKHRVLLKMAPWYIKHQGTTDSKM